jgi:hypothetical protein
VLYCAVLHWTKLGKYIWGGRAIDGRYIDLYIGSTHDATKILPFSINQLQFLAEITEFRVQITTTVIDVRHFLIVDVEPFEVPRPNLRRRGVKASFFLINGHSRRPPVLPTQRHRCVSGA